MLEFGLHLRALALVVLLSADRFEDTLRRRAPECFDTMKILICSACPLDPRLGAPKVLIEVAAAMENLGSSCRLAGVEEICPNLQTFKGFRQLVEFSASLGAFVEKHAREFDVVDYDHVCLPFARTRFPARTLLVARSVILSYHFDKIRLPSFRNLRHRIGAVVKAPLRIIERRRQIQRALRTCSEADLLNVSNDHDRTELLSRAFDAKKIVVIPFGMTEARLDCFARPSDGPPPQPRVAFVGTFDERKGGPDFPRIVRHVLRAMPECKFRLLGALYRSEDQVLSYFPSSLRQNIEVISKFEPESLPSLLHDCSLGIFPSHVEGFGFGVLEMLASSLPVIAYDAPGPPMMLPPEYLVPRGATKDLATKTLALLRDPERLRLARTWARKRARDFTWTTAGEHTIAAYSQHLAMLRERSTSA